MRITSYFNTIQPTVVSENLRVKQWVKQVNQTQTGQAPPVQRRPTPIIAIIGLLVGIVGLFIFALPCGIVAIILGIASYAREKTALAWLAVILGIVDIAAWSNLGRQRTSLAGDTFIFSIRLFLLIMTDKSQRCRQATMHYQEHRVLGNYHDFMR